MRCLQNVVVVDDFLIEWAHAAAVRDYRPVDQTFTHDKVVAASKADLVVELGIAQLRKGHQSIICVWVNHILSADLVSHSGLFVYEDTEIEAVSYGLDIESLMARLLITVTTCEELIERSELVEYAEWALAPQEELLRLTFLNWVDYDGSEAGGLNLQDLYPSVKLSNRLEGCDKVLFVALLSLN